MLYSQPVIIFLIFVFVRVQTTHFRGGTIMWKNVLIDEYKAIVSLTIKLGWRRSFSKNFFCDQNDVKGGKKLIGETGLVIVPAFTTEYFSGVYCTDYSEKEDWSYGQISITLQYFSPYADQIHLVRYAGGEWIPLLNHGYYWNLISRIDLSIQNHTGRINQSPITSMSPLIRVPTEYTTEVKIPVNDADGDSVKCRWSIADECGDSCKVPVNTELDSINCIIKFNLPPIIGYYAIRLQIEDFKSIYSTKPLSSIPLEFLVQAYKTSNSSFKIPTFEEPTKKDQACIPIPTLTTYNDIIVVNSNDFINEISDIQTISPPGLVKSALNVFNKNLSIKYINILWSPTQNQNGINIFCFIGTTDFLISTEQRCLSLAVGFEPLEAKRGTATPTGIIKSTQKEWSIDFNQNITRPKEDKFIRFYEILSNKLVFEINTLKSDHVIIQGNSLLFKVTGEFFEDKKSYYIGFDRGAFQSQLGCHVESEKIQNIDFWPVFVRNCETCAQPECKYDCSNNGICIDDNICFCYLGFKGGYCEQYNCKKFDNCSNHGNCIAADKCLCDNNWSGLSCNLPTCNLDCSLNGVCIESNKCKCNPGFRGLYCEQVMCKGLNMCSNHGTCINEDSNNERCLCNNDWTSKDCSIQIEKLAISTNSCNKFSCLGIILLVIFIILVTSIVIIIFLMTKKKKRNNSISPRQKSYVLKLK
jgi:hypothetical protein